MPHWVIYHPEGAFPSEDSRRALTKDITSLYATPPTGMPKFYVIVNFVPQGPSDMWVGGDNQRGNKFVRISIAHIHIRLPESKDLYEKITKKWSATLAPHLEGYDWEYHIDETERLLWHINGLAPPESKSEDEKVWIAENRAVVPGEMEEARKRHKL